MAPGKDSRPLYVGLMSGTSMDGIDAALLSFGNHKCDVVASRSSPFPQELVGALLGASRNPASCNVDMIGMLDSWIGECFRDAVIALLKQQNLSPDAITAIGSHGQTLRHLPRADRPFTLQLGDPNVIVAGTGITTVADFRRRDVALGGEGAPLTPAFHHWLFTDREEQRAVVNIGGIANVTLLHADATQVIGFDTGPGNTLLDDWSRRQRDLPFDDAGDWAASGRVDESLLAAMLDDNYFSLPPPKSTGFEYFNGSWTQTFVSALNGTPADADVQSTLAELTARTITTATLAAAPDVERVLVCGGGTHNGDLMIRLKKLFGGAKVTSTADMGLDPDWVEAAAFAWLAKRCLEGKTGNLPSVTGASKTAVLGAIYPGGS